MKRYFDLIGRRTVAALEIKAGSPAASASILDFEEFFRCPVRELNHAEYLRLGEEYTQPLPIPGPMNDHLISEYHVCGGGAHKFETQELHEGCTVEILRCKECGALSGAWWPGKKGDAPVIKNGLHL